MQFSISEVVETLIVLIIYGGLLMSVQYIMSML